MTRRLFEHLGAELAPVGSRSALSLRVSLIFIPIGLASQVFTDVAVNGGSPLLWFLASLIGIGVLIAGIALARLLLARNHDPGPAVVLAVFAVVGVARSFTVRFSAGWLGLTTETHFAYRLAGGVVYTPALLGVIAFAVSRLDAHRALVGALETTRESLLELERTLEADLERTTKDLATAVRDSIEPAVKAATAALTTTGGSAGQNLDALLGLVNDRVRPLSHELVSASESPRGGASASPLSTRAAKVPLPPRLGFTEGIRPFLAAVLSAVAATPSAFRDFSVTVALAFPLASFAYLAVFLMLARQLLVRLELPSALTVAVVMGLHGLGGASAVQLISLAGVPTPKAILGTGTLIAALIGTMTVVTALVDARRAATESELRSVVERLAATVEVVRRREQLTRRRLAQVLHGSLQGALYAAAMRLSEAAEPTPELVDAVRSDIQAALERLEPDQLKAGRGLLSETLTELSGTWGDRRAISTCVEPGVSERLSSDPDAEEAVAVVVREAVTNALRHANARAVQVTIRLNWPGAEGADSIDITVHDDGTGWPADRSSGLGTRLFDELCRNWKHESDASGTTFRAAVSLA